MKIKNLFLMIPFTVMVSCANSVTQNSTDVLIKGQLSNSAGTKIYLEQMSTEGLKVLDTIATDEKGEFSVKTPLTETGFYRLRIDEKNFATVIISPGEKLTITGDAKDLGNSYTVSGSKDSKLFWDLNQTALNNFRSRDSIQRVYQNFMSVYPNDKQKNDSISAVLEPTYNAIVGSHNSYLQKFVEKNPESFASLAAIQQLPADQYLATYKKLDEALLKKYPKSDYVKKFHETVASHSKLAIGSEAPDITMNTPEGKTISLSSLKGKVVLVDFWAAWCGPCRAENPNVVAAYNAFKDKGFDIFSVSLDKEAEKWKQAIAKDNLIWPHHVCDFQFWQSPVVKLYNFNSIPSSVLIDKEGKIIAKNLRGEDLHNKLREVLK